MWNMVKVLEQKVSVPGDTQLSDEMQELCEHICRCLRNLSFSRVNGEALAKMNASAPMVRPVMMISAPAAAAATATARPMPRVAPVTSISLLERSTSCCAISCFT